jgi:hypothetical protein
MTLQLIKNKNGYTLQGDNTINVLSGKYRKTDKGGEFVLSIAKTDGIKAIKKEKIGDKWTDVPVDIADSEYPLTCRYDLSNTYKDYGKEKESTFAKAINHLFANLAAINDTLTAKIPVNLADGFSGDISLGSTGGFIDQIIAGDYSKVAIAIQGGIFELKPIDCALEFITTASGGGFGGGKGESMAEIITARTAYLKALGTPEGSKGFAESYLAVRAALTEVGDESKISAIDLISMIIR